MENIFPCLSWIPTLAAIILGLFTQTRAVDLPYDVILNIFSRLPAETVFQLCHHCGSLRALTSSQSFINMHLRRGTSTIVIASNRICRTFDGKVPLYFIDDRTKKIVLRSMQINSKDHSRLALLDSCNGLLLFQNWCVFVVWNPVTGEQVIADRPYSSKARGFYFEPKTREYIILYYRCLISSFQFIEYSLGTRSLRKTTTFSHPPWNKAAVILNGTLHWVVHQSLYESTNRSSLKCSESIVAFDMDGNIRTMAIPEGYYGRQLDDTCVHLFEMGGFLCFCEATSYPNMVLWVLEDYAAEVWMKKHIISLKFLGRPYDGFRLRYIPGTIKVDKDELLLEWKQHIFRYNLKQHTSRKLKLPDVCINFFVHSSSLASLHADVVSSQSHLKAN